MLFIDYTWRECNTKFYYNLLHAVERDTEFSIRLVVFLSLYTDYLDVYNNTQYACSKYVLLFVSCAQCGKCHYFSLFRFAKRSGIPTNLEK